MSRNDLPSEKASNFSARLRETIQTMLGTRGDKLDRVVTLRDLIESGITKLAPGWRPGGAGAVPLLPGPGLPEPEVYEPDLTPPPTPTGFAVDAAISHVFIEHDAPLYPQGHGHLRTRVYGVTVQAGDPLPTFSDAVEISQFSGTVHAHPSNPATTWRLWIKWETADGVLSPSPAGGVNGVAATTGQDVSKMVLAMTGEGNPFTILAAPTTIDGFTYPAGTYSVRSFIINAQITNAKIADLAVDNAKIANVSVDKLTAGSIAVGQHIQSTGYIAGSAGWRINGDGTAEFSGVVVRGTVYATSGLIGGITIASSAVRAGQTAYNTGSGFHLGSDGRLSLGNSAGNRLSFDGANIEIVTPQFSVQSGSAVFAGSLSAASGSFSGDISGSTGSFSGTLVAGVLDVSQLVGQTHTFNTPGSYSRVVPANFTQMRVTVVGGGGGGGNSGPGPKEINPAGGGGGGGGGGTAIATFTVSPGATVSLAVGGGGGAGSTGGTSIVYGYLQANGGSAGGNGAANFTGGAGGGGGFGSVASGNAGTNGQNGSMVLDTGGKTSSPSAGLGGTGGATRFGSVGRGGNGGSLNSVSTGQPGSAGMVTVEFFNPNGVIIRSDWNTLISKLNSQGIQTS